MYCGEPRTEGAATVTVVVTSSFSKALHPSTAILTELILSLCGLGLPRASPVLLAHDSPRPAVKDTPFGEMAGQFPNAYLEYLGRVNALLPRLRACTGLALRSVLRLGRASLSNNLVLAVKMVHTPFMLKAEHDHVFIRRVPLLSILTDMQNDPRIKLVRFNRRRNLKIKCDRGNYAGAAHIAAARLVWAPHTPPLGTRLRCNYTRTPCFSDMNHLVRTEYYRDRVLPVIAAMPYTMPETVMQPRIMENMPRYGTFLFGAPGDASYIVHADAAMHGNGELVAEVVKWVHHQARVKDVATHKQSVCNSSFPIVRSVANVGSPSNV